MNLMGMGLPELAVVLLIAFLVLGPGKSIETARTLGKIVGELRRTFNDLAAAVTLEEGQERASPPPRPAPGADSDPGSKERE
jgi:sec-independent protein translocase protein TatB